MQKAQYAILRFAKYKGPGIGNIEAHNERTKEKYASNPQIDTRRSCNNFHLVVPSKKYRAVAEQQIAAAGCRTRKDSVRVVEALITATPTFFKGKKVSEAKAFFQEALQFIEAHQPKETIISAVVHMDEKTPHMHLSFVPLTTDNRLCAKEILGNKKKLTWWQDEFWKHMVKKFPDLERGESVSKTGRQHIPSRVFKEMESLTKQKEWLQTALADVKLTNYQKRVALVQTFLTQYIPNIEKMQTELEKYKGAFDATEEKLQRLQAQNHQLKLSLEAVQKEGLEKKMAEARLQRDYKEVVRTLDRIPPEVLAVYTQKGSRKKEVERNAGLE